MSVRRSRGPRFNGGTQVVSTHCWPERTLFEADDLVLQFKHRHISLTVLVNEGHFSEQIFLGLLLRGQPEEGGRSRRIVWTVLADRTALPHTFSCRELMAISGSEATQVSALANRTESKDLGP